MGHTKKVLERYLSAGAIRRDADAVAALFAEDGVYEAPLVPPGHPLHRRLAGREEIRAGIGACHRYPAFEVTVDFERSGYVLHDTAADRPPLGLRGDPAAARAWPAFHQARVRRIRLRCAGGGLSLGSAPNPETPQMSAPRCNGWSTGRS
ncbi:hypothetical protein Aau02nite_88330 [Amorphoplanes auranticolor]|uniref:SnoaL-like domain-containing protein n=1 Tax=Actinoplanes auranticolor TaxID=47988 RepID=A0A919SXR5_9ACTN|nr:hypothetical protein Aau02nite_88330 [Actinoplanes auranticolor]